jgi:hypothetical protein
MRLWKVQKLGSDIVYDLRSRNLLPIAILLIAAILLVPLLISMTGSDAQEPGASPAAESASDLAPEAQAAVLSYDPGVRDYKRRLDGLSSKDPFVQQFAAPAASALDAVDTSGGGGGEDSGGLPDLGGSTPDTGDTGGGGGGGGGKGKKKKGKTKTRYIHYEADVTAGEAGGAQTPFVDINQYTYLPSESVPVLVFLGITDGGSQAIFLVNKDVSGVGGSGVCFPSAESCQLLGLASGAAADLIYAPDGKTYSVQVQRIKRISSTKPPN